MSEHLDPPPNAIVREGKPNMYEHEIHQLLGAPGQHLENEELPSTQLLSKDEEMLARMGYKQGSTACLYLQRCPH
jgi:hypothetical protein